MGLVQAQDIIGCPHAEFTNGGGDSATCYFICRLTGKVTDPAKCGACHGDGGVAQMTEDEAIEKLSLYLHSDCLLDAPPNEAVEIAIKALRFMQDVKKTNI